MLNSLKEKEKNLKESLNKWEDKATSKKKNSMKSEDNSKAKEEKVLQLKQLLLIFKSKTSDSMMNFMN